MDELGHGDFLDDEEEENWMDTNWAGQESVGCSHTMFSPDMKNLAGNKAPGNSEQAALMTRMQLNDNKAGMEGLDKKKINQIIYEASKGSKFFENERKKEEQVNQRIEEQRKKQQKITEMHLKQGFAEADKLLEEFEGACNLSRFIVHVDMDAFYAAVEMRDDPSLRNKPMAVGGMHMLSTSNYLARKYGVRAAMPGFIGKKLCPDLVLVKPNYKQYTVISKQVREVMSEYDPNFCPMSLDEAYLDITDHVHKRQSTQEEERSFLCRCYDSSDPHFCLCDLNLNLRSSVIFGNTGETESPKNTNKKICDLDANESETTEREKTENGEFEENSVGTDNVNICEVCGKLCPSYKVVTFGLSVDDAVQEMRCRIEQKTRLTASAGIAPNMMLAKVCSDKNKPNGQYRIQSTREAVMEFIKDLPIRKISGIGKVSEKMLNALGIVTCTDLYQKRALLYHLYSPISFNYFMRICLGIGSTTVEREGERKSISTERTFSEISVPSDLYKKCSELCESLVEDLKDEELKGKTVAIKLKTVKFEVKTRAHTLRDHTADFDTIFAAAKDLLRVEIQTVHPDPLRLRLMGVRMSSLLNQSLCWSKKQDTITGLFKKMVEKNPANDSRLHNVGTVVNGPSSFTTANQIIQDNSASASPSDSQTASNNNSHMSNEKKRNATENESHLKKSLSDIVNSVSPRKLFKNNLKSPAKVKKVEKEFELKGQENIEENDKQTPKHERGNSSSSPHKKAASSDNCVDFVEDVGTETRESESLSIEKLQTFECPVCQETVSCKNLNYFNDHVDICLFKEIQANSQNMVSETIHTAEKNPVEMHGQSSDTNSNDDKPVNMSKIENTVKSKEKTSVTGKVPSSVEFSNCTHSKPELPTLDSENASVHDISSASDCEIHQLDTKSGKEMFPSNEIIPTESEGETFFICPICNAEKMDWTLETFNNHVDACLSRGAIKEILQEQKTQEQDVNKRLSSSPSPRGQPAAKKRRNNSYSSVRMKSIDSFFRM